jgi:hypothetical protein
MSEPEPIKLPDNSGEKQERNPDGTFPPGVSGNPAGRPKGSVSIRDQIRKKLEENPDLLMEIVDYFIKNNRELMWQMLEGKPKMQMEMDVPKDTLSELTDFFRVIAKPGDIKPKEEETKQQPQANDQGGSGSV